MRPAGDNGGLAVELSCRPIGLSACADGLGPKRPSDHNHRLRSHLGGYIFADQLLIPEGTRRQIVVEVNLAGAPHRFTLNLVPSGTDFPVPTGISAVPGQTIQSMQRTPETWHWTDGPPPSKVDGIPVIQ